MSLLVLLRRLLAIGLGVAFLVAVAAGVRPFTIGLAAALLAVEEPACLDRFLDLGFDNSSLLTAFLASLLVAFAVLLIFLPVIPRSIVSAIFAVELVVALASVIEVGRMLGDGIL